MSRVDGCRTPLRIGLIGYGAIGRVVATALEVGAVPGCTLAGVLTIGRSSHPLAVASPEELAGRSDLVVEAAGQQAVRDIGPEIVGAGTDLLVVSVGALGDDQLLEDLSSSGRGRLRISTGAVGGLDTLRAAMLLGPLDDVSLTTTKRSSSVDEPGWTMTCAGDSSRQTDR